MYNVPPFRPAADVSEAYKNREPWIVPGILPRDAVVILASAPKTGKTCLATALARAVAKGEPFLGRPVRQSPVLWCAYEEAPGERLALHQGLTLEDPLLVAYPGQLPPLPTRFGGRNRFGLERDYNALETPFLFEKACDAGAGLIVIDCLHAAVEGVSLTDNSDARAVMQILRTYSYHLHVTVLLLHHLTKSATRGHTQERIADSAQILAASSCHFFMEREELNETQSRITLRGRGREPAPDPRIDILSEGILDYRMQDPGAETAPRKRLTCTDRILGLLEEGWVLTGEQIARRVGCTPTHARNILRKLESTAQVHPVTKNQRSQRYAVTNPCNLNEEDKNV